MQISLGVDGGVNFENFGLSQWENPRPKKNQNNDGV